MIFVHILEPLAALLCATFNWQEGPIKGTQLLVPPKGVNFLVYGTFLLLLLFVFFFLLLLQFHFFSFPIFFLYSLHFELEIEKKYCNKKLHNCLKVQNQCFYKIIFPSSVLTQIGKKININFNFSSFEAKSTAFLTYTFFQNLFHSAALPHLFLFIYILRRVLHFFRGIHYLPIATFGSNGP